MTTFLHWCLYVLAAIGAWFILSTAGGLLIGAFIRAGRGPDPDDWDEREEAGHGRHR